MQSAELSAAAKRQNPIASVSESKMHPNAVHRAEGSAVNCNTEAIS